ncbi:MAG TPA: hypothetical protein VGH38_25995 [Bryobacteraceae bacterium]
MNIDERLEAVATNLELLTQEVQDLKIVVKQDTDNVRALTAIVQTTHDSVKRLENIAAAHDRRIEGLDKH